MRVYLSLLLLAVLALAGCAQPTVPEDHFYRLTLNGPAAEPDAGPGAGKLAGIVEVERFIADGLTAARPIVFSDSRRGNVAQTYNYHYWIEPPTILLQIALSDYLRKAGVGTSVVTPELRVDADYVITGRIRAFEHMRADGTVRAALELSVRRMGTDRLVLFKSYEVARKTANDSVGTAAAEMSAAIDEIFAQFVADLPAR